MGWCRRESGMGKLQCAKHEEMYEAGSRCRWCEPASEESLAEQSKMWWDLTPRIVPDEYDDEEPTLVVRYVP